MSNETTKSNDVVEAKAPRDKYKAKGVRGVLVNLDLALAEEFYKLARQDKLKPTKVARELITRWVVEQTTKNV